LAPRIITGLLRDSLHFHGVAITDAMTMEGIGKGYGAEQSSVLAVQAGAEILLKPSDATRAINAVVAAVERGEISRSRIDSAARHVLELKARSGVAFAPTVSLERLREVVGSPAHRAIAAGVARRAITLLRDRDNLVPMHASRVAVVQYAPETEIKAGRAFLAALRQSPALSARGSMIQAGKLVPTATPDALAAVDRAIGDAETVIVAAFVRRVEGEGRVAVPPQVAAWIDGLATRRMVIVVAFGNPYVIRQLPNIGTYLVTYGVTDDLERASARAILGADSVTGVVPVSLPGFFRAGDGIRR
jgi:beta-N-acetylhexosaminidase